MYLLIFFLIVFLLLVSFICKREPYTDAVQAKGDSPLPYNTLEYTRIADASKPPQNKCIDIITSKGWIDPYDKSTKGKQRLNVLADMEVSKIRQPMHGSFIYPSVDACTIPSEVIDIYYNVNPEKPTIDKTRCDMKGMTANNDVVFYQLTPVDAKSPYNPKGCMVNLDEHDMGSFQQFLDDAYQLKMYPELSEKMDYKNTISVMGQKNDELLNQYKQALNKNKVYEQQMVPSKTDEIIDICRDVYTDWQDATDWTYNALDKHDVTCAPNEVMSRFQLLTAYRPDKVRYKYRCCKVDTAPIPKRLKENVITSGTPFQNSQLWNAMGLTSHSLRCPKASENQQSMLKQFKLEPQYVNQVTANARYNYSCSSFDANGIPGGQVVTECRKMKTQADDASPTFNVLDRHDVVCEDGEGISDVGLKSDGTRFYYEYSCCRPKLSKNE